MALKASPPHNKAEITNMLSKTLVGGGEPDTHDAGGSLISTHRGFDKDTLPQPNHPNEHGVQVNPNDRPGAFQANRDLATAIQNLLNFGGLVNTTPAGNPVPYVVKDNASKFLMTWRMYSKGGEDKGACGCGCGCG